MEDIHGAAIGRATAEHGQRNPCRIRDEVPKGFFPADASGGLPTGDRELGCSYLVTYLGILE